MITVFCIFSILNILLISWLVVSMDVDCRIYMDIMTGNDYGSFRLLFHVLFIGQTGLSRKRGGDGLKGGG